jgi:hypothetical protein
MSINEEIVRMAKAEWEAIKLRGISYTQQGRKRTLSELDIEKRKIDKALRGEGLTNSERKRLIEEEVELNMKKDVKTEH